MFTYFLKLLTKLFSSLSSAIVSLFQRGHNLENVDFEIGGIDFSPCSSVGVLPEVLPEAHGSPIGMSQVFEPPPPKPLDCWANDVETEHFDGTPSFRVTMPNHFPRKRRCFTSRYSGADVTFRTLSPIPEDEGFETPKSQASPLVTVPELTEVPREESSPTPPSEVERKFKELCDEATLVIRESLDQVEPDSGKDFPSGHPPSPPKTVRSLTVSRLRKSCILATCTIEDAQTKCQNSTCKHRPSMRLHTVDDTFDFCDDHMKKKFVWGYKVLRREVILWHDHDASCWSRMTYSVRVVNSSLVMQSGELVWKHSRKAKYNGGIGVHKHKCRNCDFVYEHKHEGFEAEGILHPEYPGDCPGCSTRLT